MFQYRDTQHGSSVTADTDTFRLDRPPLKSGAGVAVDAVITWVDGNDPAHRQRLAAYLARAGIVAGGSTPGAAQPTRFGAAGEMDFCVRSILRHAPWIRRVYIVSDRQTPQIVEELARSEHADRLRLVDHRELFTGFERYLPTFNSRSIISLLWRIDGLAEHFVYFNDDMVLLRDVQADDFFRDDALVLRGQWQPTSSSAWHRRLWHALKYVIPRKRQRPGNIAAQELSALVAGSARRFFRLKHFPYPMRRSTLAAFFRDHPGLLQRNVRHRLRSKAQFKTESLAAHLELLHGHALIDNHLRLVELEPRKQSAARIRRELARAVTDERARFLCVQSLDMAPPAMRGEILAWLSQRERSDG